MKLSVTIITFNEERNIARAIKSANFADEIIIVDSGSSDKTVEIAQFLGAHVVHNPFRGYGEQKNFAASVCKGEWILNIDADEEITPKLQQSIKESLKLSHPIFSISRRNNYCGKWIYHGGWYPDRRARLCKKGEANWSEPNVHEDLVAINGTSPIPLKGDLNHYSFPTIQSQISTNLKYAKLGGRELLRRKGRPALFKIFLKPFWKFIECYLLKFGFLDGLYGFVIAINAAHSLFLKYVFAYQGEVND